MEVITRHSITRATEAAVQLWAFSSTQYPKDELIVEVARTSIIDVVSVFALNARRSLEVLPQSEKFSLRQPRWNWKPTVDGEVVNDLWEALNRIIHAQNLDVCFELLPAGKPIMDGGSIVVPYIRVATDRKKIAFIDTFALSHAFLYDVYPKLLVVANQESKPTDGLR